MHRDKKRCTETLHFINEGDSRLTEFTFVIARSSNTTATSVQYQTIDDTALANSDYTALSLTTLEFAAGGTLTFPDERDYDNEERFINIGISSKAKVLVVIHTEREAFIRIISSRKATKFERRTYEEGIF